MQEKTIKGRFIRDALAEDGELKTKEPGVPSDKWEDVIAEEGKLIDAVRLDLHRMVALAQRKDFKPATTETTTAQPTEPEPMSRPLRAQPEVRDREGLRFQIATSKKGRGGRRYLPYAFTEQGVAMLSSVLRSKRAIAVNVEIMRAFVRLRQLLASNSELARRLDELEKKYDHQFSIVFDAIRALMAEPYEKTDTPRIGYETEREHPR